MLQIDVTKPKLANYNKFKKFLKKYLHYLNLSVIILRVEYFDYEIKEVCIDGKV